ncbi:MAG TPA: 2-phosphosulfolactate phosphatase, partial [Flavobacteriales bacterium]|nr:2-phosphosulfolactate phosphatase [Flavobacteriales bacterium]
KSNVVVVIDILRATSAICTALYHGAKKIIPVVSVEVAKEYLNKADIVGAERGGQIVEGFEYGNSPFCYAGSHVKDKTIVLTTSNGTFSIAAAQNAEEVIIGSFLNLDSVVKWILSQSLDVVLLCSGWKRKFNLEDSLFAGAIVDELVLSGKNLALTDSAIAACELYKSAKGDLNGFLKDSSHRNRLKNLKIEKDVEYCLKLNQMDLIPVLTADGIVRLDRK